MSNINGLNNEPYTILIDGLPAYQVNAIEDKGSPFYYGYMKENEYPAINKILKKWDKKKFNKIRSVLRNFSDEKLFALEFFDLLETKEIEQQTKEFTQQADFIKNIRLKINFLKEIKDQNQRIKVIESIKDINQFNENGDSLEINKEFIDKLVKHRMDSKIIANNYLNEIKDNLIRTKEEKLKSLENHEMNLIIQDLKNTLINSFPRIILNDCLNKMQDGLSNINDKGEELTGEELTGEELTGEELTGEELTGEELTGEELTGEELQEKLFSLMNEEEQKFLGMHLPMNLGEEYSLIDICSKIINNNPFNDIEDNSHRTELEELYSSMNNKATEFLSSINNFLNALINDKKKELNSLKETLNSFITTKASNLTNYLDTNKDKGLEENLFNFINDGMKEMEGIINAPSTKINDSKQEITPLNKNLKPNLRL